MEKPENWGDRRLVMRSTFLTYPCILLLDGGDVGGHLRRAALGLEMNPAVGRFVTKPDTSNSRATWNAA
jgi:hypothetical protein